MNCHPEHQKYPVRRAERSVHCVLDFDENRIRTPESKQKIRKAFKKIYSNCRASKSGLLRFNYSNLRKAHQQIALWTPNKTRSAVGAAVVFRVPMPCSVTTLRSMNIHAAYRKQSINQLMNLVWRRTGKMRILKLLHFKAVRTFFL